jgi:succinate dehydrogenase / fumarate reductase cytochrome b subunit
MAIGEVPPVKSRPVYLNLARIRQPIPAIVSILHRISGAGLTVFGIALLLWGLQASLRSPDDFAQLASWFDRPIVKLVFLGFVWAYLHHFFAGLRFLFLDVHIGDTLKQARASGVAVIAVSLLLTVLAAVWLW